MNMEEEFKNIQSFLAAGEFAIKVAAECDNLRNSVSENFGDLSCVMSLIPETLTFRAYIIKAIIIAGYFADSTTLSTKEDIAICDILRKLSNKLIKEEKLIREIETQALKKAIEIFDAQQK